MCSSPSAPHCCAMNVLSFSHMTLDWHRTPSLLKWLFIHEHHSASERHCTSDAQLSMKWRARLSFAKTVSVQLLLTWNRSYQGQLDLLKGRYLRKNQILWTAEVTERWYELREEQRSERWMSALLLSTVGFHILHSHLFFFNLPPWPPSRAPRETGNIFSVRLITSRWRLKRQSVSVWCGFAQIWLLRSCSLLAQKTCDVSSKILRTHETFVDVQ